MQVLCLFRSCCANLYLILYGLRSCVCLSCVWCDVLSVWLCAWCARVLNFVCVSVLVFVNDCLVLPCGRYVIVCVGLCL